MTVIHSLLPHDFDAVCEIFKAVFPAKYYIEFLDAWKYRNIDMSVGAYDEKLNTLIGFILCSTKEPNQVCIEFLGVSPTSQKGGIGTVLLSHTLKRCVASHLHVMLIPVNDAKIIQWYKRNGFVEHGAPGISRYTGDLEQPMAYRCTVGGV